VVPRAAQPRALTPRRALAGALLAVAAAAVQAGSLRLCDMPASVDAREQDRLLQFAALVKAELDAAGGEAAIVARSGLALDRFGVRYSHAGIALRRGDTPWAVRQLYYACDEQRPRLYDQGMAGFVMGSSAPESGRVAIVLLPRDADAALARTAADTPRALQLLGARYSANAYAFGEAFQNCNQWVAELLALAWGAPDGAGTRASAQRWLQAEGYRPHVFALSPLWMWLGLVVPWVHHADHPAHDVAGGIYRVSMPDAIETFVHERVPGAQRIELCRREGRVVVRRGWAPIVADCVPAADDRIVTLDDRRD
jgi:hypothetical protein